MKKNGIVMIVLFVLSVVSTSLNAQTTEIEKWAIRGEEYYEKRDYINAINAYSQVIDLRLKEESEAQERAKARATNPVFYTFNRTWTGTEINAYWQRGRSYYRLKNYDAAIADYLVVEKNYDGPNSYHIYVSLGDAYGAKKDYNNAASYYRKYVEKKPGNELINFNVDKTDPADMWFCAIIHHHHYHPCNSLHHHRYHLCNVLQQHRYHLCNFLHHHRYHLYKCLHHHR
jgi:tetratricopeptide (TPR) repeat protein